MRAELIDAAEELIREEGYPAVTSRTLAEKVGLKRQIVHYYFRSMDDLFIAVVRRAADRMRESVAAAAASNEPLRELQRINQDPRGAILSMELHALANRRPAVRAEVARAAEEFRDLQTQILTKLLEHQGVEPAIRPVVAIVLLSSLAQVLAVESAIDVSRGHAETLEYVDECLRAFALGEPPPLAAAQAQPIDPSPKRRRANASAPARHP